MGWVVRITPRSLYLRRIAIGNLLIGDWVSPRACLEVLEKRKILLLSGFEPLLFSSQPVALPTELSRLLNEHWGDCNGHGLFKYMRIPNQVRWRKARQNLSNWSPNPDTNQRIFISLKFHTFRRRWEETLFLFQSGICKKMVVTLSYLAILTHSAAHNDCVVRRSGIREFSLRIPFDFSGVK
jgi:hypothetical protein